MYGLINKDGFVYCFLRSRHKFAFLLKDKKYPVTKLRLDEPADHIMRTNYALIVLYLSILST